MRNLLSNSYFRVALFVFMLVGSISGAAAIKTWANGDTLTATDLNSNFQHIHNLMVGGHGARLVDADVSASASIGYTKVQNGRGIARAWVVVESTCVASPCTMTENLNGASVTRGGTGAYTFTLSYTATDADFGTIASSATSGVTCTAVSATTTTVTVGCTDLTTVAADAAFTVMVLDGD